ncbi:MAG: GDSL-type esterase/lipase family protein [Phycisphaerae bacterium]|nr:GDSL-type esterase/lipase family protein [Phycisphaerae bacterium]
MPERRIGSSLIALVVAAFVTIMLSAASVRADAPKRVAVIGDATALGQGREARMSAWPMQLGRMLGRGWLVQNFSRGAASLDPVAQRFMCSLPEWPAAKTFEPDVVVIALGASDAVESTFKAAPRVPAGIDQILKELSALPKKPVVYLCLPPPAAPDWRRAGTYELATKELTVILSEAATRNNSLIATTVIDTRAPLVGKESHLVSGFLPDDEGGRLVAATVFKSLTSSDAPADLGPYRRTSPPTGLIAVDFVKDGEPLRMRGNEKWFTKDGALEHVAGGGSVLMAPIETGVGDFRMRATIWIEGGERHGPQFGVDGNWIAMENARGNVVADGAVFRGRPYIGRTSEVVKRGTWMEVEIRRVGVDLEFIANGELLVVVPAPGEKFTRFVLDPQAARLRVKNWTVETESDQPAVSVPIAPKP